MQLYTTSEEYKNAINKLFGSNPSEVEKHVCGIIIKDINRKKVEKTLEQSTPSLSESMGKGSRSPIRQEVMICR